MQQHEAQSLIQIGYYKKISWYIYQNSVAMVTAESGEIEPAIPR